MAIKTIYVQPGVGFDRVTLGVTESSAPKRGEIIYEESHQHFGKICLDI